MSRASALLKLGSLLGRQAASPPWPLHGFRLLSNSSFKEVEEINREMADVFGVPFAPPEGTCLAPPSSTAADSLLSAPPSGMGDLGDLPLPPAAFSQGQQQQQLLTPAAEKMMQELRQCTQQLQRQVQQLQQMLLHQRQGSSAAVQNGGAVSGPADATAAQLDDGATAAAQGEGSQHPQQQQQQQQQQLSHVDSSGRASMVDVAHKPSSGRVAAATCRVLLGEAAFRAVADNAIAKGDVLRIAQVAGIQGAKATAQLIPLCHNIFISSVHVDLALDPSSHAVDITATARASGQTGVEMEALTGAAVAALTVYDMAKAVHKGIRITDLQLLFKEGGKSGPWHRRTEGG